MTDNPNRDTNSNLYQVGGSVAGGGGVDIGGRMVLRSQSEFEAVEGLPDISSAAARL